MFPTTRLAVGCNKRDTPPYNLATLPMLIISSLISLFVPAYGRHRRFSHANHGRDIDLKALGPLLPAYFDSRTRRSRDTHTIHQYIQPPESMRCKIDHQLALCGLRGIPLEGRTQAWTSPAQQSWHPVHTPRTPRLEHHVYPVV